MPALTVEQFLDQFTPLVKDLADGTITEAAFETAAKPVFENFLLGDARVANIISQVTATVTFENRLSSFVSDWYAGTATGGPLSNGTYPLPNSEGTLFYVPSPAKLAQVIAKGDKGDTGDNARHSIGFFAQYTYGPSEVLCAYVAPNDENYVVAESHARCMTAPTGSAAVITIKKNGSAWGTVTFAEGSTTGVFSITTPTQNAGELLTFEAPAVTNGTFTGVTITLAGT